MNRFFDMDNPFFTFMSRVADLLILNLICLVCCLPIVTIGPSLTALFYMTLKMVRNEESYLLRGFFKSFKQNLKQGILINLILLLAGGLLILDFRIMQSMQGAGGKVFYFLLFFILVLYLMIFVYIYPILAKFDNTIRNTFINALLMAIRHLPYTMLMILVTVLPFVGFFFLSGRAQSLILMLAALFGIAALAYVNSHFLVKIFDNYIPEEAGELSQDNLS